ncbi:unnamed protein product [Cylindrotheca closterium]|uniref:Phosphodiesterase n=1 Tax=Cylindrotheca closterium TaxID=2856 RepID=A0AAD2G3Q7_9STRA|nr:unnamed protein product [Cylindrotheca closterium]
MMRISNHSRKRQRGGGEQKTAEYSSTLFQFFSNNSKCLQTLCLLTLCQVVLSAYHYHNVYKTTKTFSSFGSSSTSLQFASSGNSAIPKHHPSSPVNSALHVSFAASAAANARVESVAANPLNTYTNTDKDGTTTTTTTTTTILPEWNELSGAAQTELQQMLNWDKVSTFDYPEIFRLDELTQGHSLLFMSWAIVASPYSQPLLLSSSASQQEQQDNEYCNLLDAFGISPTAFMDYVRTIEQGYQKNNPYHNHIHAADVLQTLHSMLQSESYRLTKVQHFSLLLAAILHDVGHDGTNNDFQVQTQSQLAIRYQNVSVLEQHHVEVGLKQLDSSELLDHLPLQERDEIRQFIAQAILHTDMAKHQEQVERASQAASTPPQDDDDDWQAAMYLLHLCDISNPTKSTFSIWTEHVLEEFYQLGDLQKSLGLPVSFDRSVANSNSKVSIQQGFLKFLVLPAFEAMEFSNPKIMQGLYANYEYWMKQDKEEDAETAAEAAGD